MYLPIYLRRTGEPSARFFGAAIDVTLPSPKDEDKARRNELTASARPSTTSAAKSVAPTRASSGHFPTEDSNNVADTPLALKIALTSSGRAEDEKMRPLLEEMLAPEAEGKSLSEFFTTQALKSWDTRGVVWFARALGIRSIGGDPLATTYVTDLLAFLDRLPPRTATGLYLGLLGAAYLEGEEVRTVPRGAWLDQIFRYQPSAKAAIEAFRNYISGAATRPVYGPDHTAPLLTVNPLLQSAKEGVPRMVGLQIGEIGVITEVQTDENYRLSNRFPGRQTITVDDAVREVCAILGIPVDQIERSDALLREVRFGSTVGIASPDDLRNDMEDQT